MNEPNGTLLQWMTRIDNIVPTLNAFGVVVFMALLMSATAIALSRRQRDETNRLNRSRAY